MPLDAPFPRVVSLACHDLRTPLATIYGFARTLSRGEDLDAVARRANAWLLKDYAVEWREWAYKGVPPQLLVEPMLGDGREPPEDYKLFTFDGQVYAIQVDTGRFTAHRRSFYTPDWRLMPCRVTYPQADQRKPPPHLDKLVAANGVNGRDALFWLGPQGAFAGRLDQSLKNVAAASGAYAWDTDQLWTLSQGITVTHKEGSVSKSLLQQDFATSSAGSSLLMVSRKNQTQIIAGTTLPPDDQQHLVRLDPAAPVHRQTNCPAQKARIVGRHHQATASGSASSPFSSWVKSV